MGFLVCQCTWIGKLQIQRETLCPTHMNKHIQETLCVHEQLLLHVFDLDCDHSMYKMLLM